MSIPNSTTSGPAAGLGAGLITTGISLLDPLEPRVLFAAAPVESWSNAKAGRYVPRGDQTVVAIQGDLGRWRIGDDISNFPNEYPPTPNYAQVSGGKLTLRAEAEADAGYGSSLRIWAGVGQGVLNPSFGIRIDPSTRLTFEASGFLESPYDGLTTPGYRDEVDLVFFNKTDQFVTLVLDRHPDARAFQDYDSREVFLDPDAGSYTVDLGAVFQQIPGFDADNPNSWVIRSIYFGVSDTGWGTLDNLRFSSTNDGGGGPTPTPLAGPTTVTLRPAKGKRRVTLPVRLTNASEQPVTVTTVTPPVQRAFRITFAALPQGGLELPAGAGLSLVLSFRSNSSGKRRLVDVLRITTDRGQQAIRLVGINRISA